jgi:hypothetical protein
MIVALLIAAPGVFAGKAHDHEHDHKHEQDHRQYGTHVHGIGELNLVLEGGEVHLVLNSPAANIVGFEHAPSSAEDHAALERAVGKLEQGDGLFRFDSAAGCRMDTVRVTSALIEDKHAGHEKDHDHDHGHDAKDQHDHESHADIEASYRFTCRDPGRITRLDVELFASFPGTEKLEVQYVMQDRQGAAELTARRHVVRF